MPDLKSFSDLPAMAEDTSTIEPIPELPPTAEETALMGDIDKNFEESEKAVEDASPEPEPDDKSKRERDEAGKFKGKQEPKAKDASELTSDKVDAAKKTSETPEPPKEESDEEVDGIEKPKLHPSKLKGWDALQTTAKQRGRELKEARAEIDRFKIEVEEAKKAAPLNDEERQELKRLQDFEFIKSPEKSGRITREFDSKLTKLDEEIYPLLEKAVGMPATKAEAQKQFDALTPEQKAEIKSPRYSLEELKASGGVSSIAYNAWEQQVLKNEAIDGRARAKLQKALNDHFDTKEAREQAIAQAPKDKEAWEKQQTEAQKAEGEKYNAQLRENATKLQTSLGEWALEKPVPPTATATQKAEIDAHNRNLKEKVYPAFIANLDVSTPDKHAKVAMGVGSPVALHYQAESERLSKALEVAEKRAKEAEEKYSGVKKAGSISQARQNAPKQSSAPAYKSSIDANWEAAEAGCKPMMVKGSSNVKGIIHEPKTGTLSVAFKNGSTYHYANVTREQHAALMKADSKGSWISDNLVRKPNSHPATKEAAKPAPKHAQSHKPPRHVLGMGKFMGNYQQPPAP